MSRKQDQARGQGQGKLELCDGKDHEFQVYSGTQGPNAVDIRKLYDEVDIFTYDPGFTSTASN